MASLQDHNAEHFDKAAKTWDATSYIVEVAEAFSQKLAEKVQLEGKVLLDVGAGTGLVAQRLAAKAKQVVGIDISAEMVKALNSKRESISNIVGLCVDVTDEDAFAAVVKDQSIPETYDLAYIHLVLHHIEDMEGMIKRMAALTKPGGYVAISDILKTDVSEQFHGHKVGHAAHHTVAHHGGMEPSLVTQMLENAGLTNVDITPNAVLMRREHEAENGEKVSSQHPLFLALAQKQ